MLASWSGNHSKVNPGELSVLSQRISECLRVLYNEAWEKFQSTGWSFRQITVSWSESGNLNPSLKLPLNICWFVFVAFWSNSSLISSTSLLIVTCCGVPIFRHSPTYTDSDIVCRAISLKHRHLMLLIFLVIIKNILNLNNNKVP